MGAYTSCFLCGGTIGAYASLVAGDTDYELTFHGVRKTDLAIAREEREREDNLRHKVGLREAQCAKLETEIANSKAIAMQCKAAAMRAPGGLNGVHASRELSRAKQEILQMARINMLLQQERTKVEAGRRALEAIHARVAIREDREYIDSIRSAAMLSEIPDEQLTYVQDAGDDAVDQFERLDEQNSQYNDILQNMDQSLAQSRSSSLNSMFGDFDLNDTASLLAALDSMSAESHQDTVEHEKARAYAAQTPSVPEREPRPQYASFAPLTEQNREAPRATVQQQNPAARSTHSQSKLPRAPLDARVAAYSY